MVETLGGHEQGRGTTRAACATFALGALAGGVLTFGALSVVGRVIQAGLGVGALAVAAGVAAIAAFAEARGLRVLPQIRRQVPEPWRRTLPLPLAASLYGVLLGLGFTTFVLTVATWALAGISLALGRPEVGVAIGLAFGAGRALPVVAIAPRLRTPWGARMLGAMAERPRLLQVLRLGDALALGACAVALGSAPAQAAVHAAATQVAAPATDPSVAGDDVVWQRPGGPGFLRHAGKTIRLPGTDPALGGPHLAFRSGDQVTVVRRADASTVFTHRFQGVDKLAVSAHWLAVRIRRPGGGDRIVVRQIGSDATNHVVASVAAPAQLGRPALAGRWLVFVSSGRSGSRLVRVRLGAHRRRARTLRHSGLAQYLSAAVAHGHILYVSSSRAAQQLHLMRTGGAHDHVLMRTGGPAGPRTTFWTVALSARRAYLTRLGFAGDGGASASIVRIGL